MTRISDRTVLFADLRGSTALFETLGNAEATSVVTHCVNAMAGPVASYEGTLVKTLGDPARPAFLCTADEMPLVEQPAREAGFTGCWTKPVALDQVLAELQRRSGHSANSGHSAPR